MCKKLTYDDVLSEAVYSILEVLRKKHEEAILKELKTTDVLTMATNQLGEMMEIITSDLEYRKLINKKFSELRTKYISEDNYDPSGETITEERKSNDDTPEDINFGF